MKFDNKWSYSPYRPFFFETGDIYICRIVPCEHSIHIEWLPDNATEKYSVYYKKRKMKSLFFSKISSPPRQP